MTRPIPPYALAALAGGAQLLAAGSTRPTRASTAAAAAFGAPAAALGGGAVLRYLRAHTTLNPGGPERSTALITDGPNAWTRNPLYAAFTLLLTAHALFRRSPAGLVAAAAFAVAVDRGQIPLEEEALAARFGDEYEAYRRRVPRWLPPFYSRNSGTKR